MAENTQSNAGCLGFSPTLRLGVLSKAAEGPGPQQVPAPGLPGPHEILLPDAVNGMSRTVGGHVPMRLAR